MDALQASISLSSSSSFFGQLLSSPRFSPPATVENREKPCLIFSKVKLWERKECKPNSLPILHKMHVKVGDKVKVISGRDKGKIGEITLIFKHNSTVVVGEINLKTKHIKSREEGEQGQIMKVEGPVHSWNVMLCSKDKEVASRVGHKVLDDGSRVHCQIKTGEIIDSAENWRRLKESKGKTGGNGNIIVLLNASSDLCLMFNIKAFEFTARCSPKGLYKPRYKFAQGLTVRS